MSKAEIFHLELPKLPHLPDGDTMAKQQEQLALVALGDMARQVWLKLAADHLTTTRRTYQMAIQQPAMEGQSSVVVVLAGKEANAIEHGVPAYDMRKTLLGPNVPVVPVRSGQRGKHKAKNGGYFRAIPFSHSGPGGQGATGTPMGMAHSNDMGAGASLALGKKVQAAAKKLKPSFETAGRKMQWGGRLAGNIAPKLRPHHTTSIYTGMVKVAKDYKNTKTGKTTRQFTYKTFRTISTNVLRGWMHRATPGANLLAMLKSHMQREAPRLLASIYQGKEP